MRVDHRRGVASLAFRILVAQQNHKSVVYWNVQLAMPNVDASTDRVTEFLREDSVPRQLTLAGRLRQRRQITSGPPARAAVGGPPATGACGRSRETEAEAPIGCEPGIDSGAGSEALNVTRHASKEGIRVD